MKKTIVLLSGFLTMLSTLTLASAPEQGLSLGTRVWPPVTNGLVFINGEFILPPYILSRVENKILVNGRDFETSVAWPPNTDVSPPPPPQNDPVMPDTITENSTEFDKDFTEFIADKRAYLFSKNGEEEGVRRMVDVLMRVPFFSKAEFDPKVPEAVKVTLKKTGETWYMSMIPQKRAPEKLSRKEVISLLDKMGDMYVKSLSRNDYYLRGAPYGGGIQGTFGNVLVPLAGALHTAKNESEFLALTVTNMSSKGVTENGLRNIYRHRNGLPRWEPLIAEKKKENHATVSAPLAESWTPSTRTLSRPKLDLTLGKRTWTPVTNGLVFVNGEFISPPYLVVRKGNHLYINGDFYVAGVCWPAEGTWAYPIPAHGLELDVPESITKGTTLFDAALNHYLDETRNIMVTVYGEEEASKHLVDIYKKLPCVQNAVLDTNTICTISVTWMSGETYRINEFPPEQWTGKISREIVIRVVDDAGEELVRGLAQNRCFMVGSPSRRGQQESFAKALSALANALRTAKDEYVFLAIMTTNHPTSGLKEEDLRGFYRNKDSLPEWAPWISGKNDIK